MRQRRSWSVDALTVGAIGGSVVALLVLLVDGYLVLTRLEGSAALLNGEFPWMLVATPIFVLAGLLIGSRSNHFVSLSVILIAIAEERFQQSLLPHGGINLRLDELLAPSITFGLLTQEWQTGRLRRELERIPGLIPLALFMVANLIPTALIMQDQTRGASLFIILLAGAGCYVGVAILAARVGCVRDIVLPLTIVGGLEAAFGLGTLALSVWRGEAVGFGIQIEPVTGLFEAYGTMFEANFFGQYLAAIFLIAVAFLVLLASQRRLWSRDSAVLAPVVLLSALGVLASETRASWLGLVAGVLTIAALWSLRTPEPHSAQRAPRWAIGRWAPSLAMLAILLLVASAVFMFSGASSPLGQRLSAVVNFTSGSGYGRLRILQLVLGDLANPIIGMGDGSFNTALPIAPGLPPEPHPWIYSMFLAILHDSGIVGLLLWLTFLAVIYYRLVRVIRGDFPQSIQTLAIAMAGALTCLLISAQATTSMYLIFFWAFLGLAGAVPLLAAPIGAQRYSATAIDTSDASHDVAEVNRATNHPVPRPA